MKEYIDEDLEYACDKCMHCVHAFTDASTSPKICMKGFSIPRVYCIHLIIK